MTLAFDQPCCFESVLGRWDPRWKLAGLGLAALAAALLQTLPVAALALALAGTLVVLGRLPLKWYLRRMAGLCLLLALFVIWLPLLDPGEGPTWDFGFLQLSWSGLRLALLICLKTLAMVTIMLVLWVSAPLENNLKAMHCLRVPGLVVQLLALTYRYVFLLAEELGRLRNALRVRGYRNRANLHSYRTLGHVTGSMLIRSYERAERVGQAMRCRGFDGRFRSLTDFQTRPLDVLGFLGIVSPLAGLLAWDFLSR